MLKNITLSAEESLIHLAREKAKKNKKSLNIIFREWLARYAANDRVSMDYQTLMKKLKYAKVGKHFTRDEMNER